MMLMLALLLTMAPAAPTPPWHDFYAADRHEAAPRAVRALVIRLQGCSHWAGEEGTDAARRAEIRRAQSHLRCATVERDLGRARQRYAGDAAISQLLTHEGAVLGD